MQTDSRHKSRALLEGRDRAPARSYLKGMGYTEEDLNKPIVGVAHTWIETMPCNFNQRRLAERVKDGIREAGGTPMELNTVAISDGITMGTEGMKTSLVSREVIADSIELVGRGHMFDAVVSIVGCDKTIPAGAMALVRLGVPGLVVYGGAIVPGRFQGHDVTIQDVFEAVGSHAVGKINDEDYQALEDNACPGAGACGGQFTANTMALALQFLGLSPMGSADPAANDPRKDEVCVEAGKLVMQLLDRGVAAKDILTKASFENAIASVAATGGSTNAVLAPARHSPRSRHRTGHRRLRPGQRPHPDHRRPEARWPLRRRGHGPGRRLEAPRQTSRRSRSRGWRATHLQRSHHRGGSRGREGSRGAGCDPL